MTVRLQTLGRVGWTCTPPPSTKQSAIRCVKRDSSGKILDEVYAIRGSKGWIPLKETPGSRLRTLCDKSRPVIGAVAGAALGALGGPGGIVGAVIRQVVKTN